MSVVIEGAEEFRQALRHLPEDLAREGAAVVLQAAEETAQALSSNYPVRTGNLQRGVKVVVNDSGRLGIIAKVVSASRHAHLFERGTVVRTTKRGANRGQMNPAPEHQRLIPRAIRARQKMTAQLVQIVEDAGFEVKL